MTVFFQHFLVPSLLLLLYQQPLPLHPFLYFVSATPPPHYICHRSRKMNNIAKLFQFTHLYIQCIFMSQLRILCILKYHVVEQVRILP